MRQVFWSFALFLIFFFSHRLAPRLSLSQFLFRWIRPGAPVNLQRCQSNLNLLPPPGTLLPPAPHSARNSAVSSLARLCARDQGNRQHGLFG